MNVVQAILLFREVAPRLSEKEASLLLEAARALESAKNLRAFAQKYGAEHLTTCGYFDCSTHADTSEGRLRVQTACGHTLHPSFGFWNIVMAGEYNCSKCGRHIQRVEPL